MAARLDQVGRALDQGRANLDPELASPLIVERGLGSAKGGARYVRELVPMEVPEGPARDKLREAAEGAGQAFDGWIAHLSDLQQRATGHWRFGEERYSRLLRERESLDHDARSLREMGRAEYDRLDAEMRELALRAKGTDDWRAVLHEANEHHPPTEEQMRQSYEEWTERSRQFLIDTGLVTLPDGEACSVEPSPVFQRPVLGVASYMGPPALTDRLQGHFFVPYAPDGTPPDEVQTRLAANSYDGIPTTAVHETYPGHHWHISWSKTTCPPIRLVLGTPYFTEGWALYAERVMRERGFFTDPVQELYHLEATLFRAARIIVDTSLHIGEMDFEEAVTFMTTMTPLPEPTARAEVGRYCWWPTQASAYRHRVPGDPAHPRCVPGRPWPGRTAAQRGRGVGAARLPRPPRRKRATAARTGRARCARRSRRPSIGSCNVGVADVMPPVSGRLYCRCQRTCVG